MNENGDAKAAILVLAGGLATRLGPLAHARPKLLVDVAGQPFVNLLFERLRASGLDDVVLATGHLGAAVHAAIGDGSAHGLRVRYSEDGDEPRGTAGAIVAALARDLLPDPFLVTYGDSLLPFDYRAPLRALETEPTLDGVMSVFANHGAYDTSNTVLSPGGDRVVRYEKRAATASNAWTHIDYGCLAFRHRAFAGHPRAGDLANVQTRLAATGRLGAVLATERFWEVGSPLGLAALAAHIAASRRST